MSHVPRGEPGIGKTLLWQIAVAMRRRRESRRRSTCPRRYRPGL